MSIQIALIYGVDLKSIGIQNVKPKFSPKVHYALKYP